jgi:hypothetical protein
VGTGRRQALIDQFNSPPDSSKAPDVMLLTTQAGFFVYSSASSFASG